jgi:hypothetical protein
MNRVMECDKCYIISPGDYIPEEGFFDKPCNNIIKGNNGSHVCGGKWVSPNKEIEKKRRTEANKVYCTLDPKTNPGIFLVVLDSKNRMMRSLDFYEASTCLHKNTFLLMYISKIWIFPSPVSIWSYTLKHNYLGTA